MARLILGNLDCDQELSGGWGGSVSGDVLRTISPLATLLRVFAAEGDRLWTPAPVDPDCMAGIPGLPLPALESGPVRGLSVPGALLAWAETESAAKLRRSAQAPSASCEVTLAQRLERLPAPSPAIVSQVNHRAFCLEVSRSLGCALEGAALLRSLAEVQEHLRQGGAAASAGGRFVLKAPWSSSGRSRAILSAAEFTEARWESRVRKLFATHQELLFEPWMDRQADFGCTALLCRGEVELLGIHAQQVDPREGRFLGIQLETSGIHHSSLTTPERTLLEKTAQEVGSRLHERGYSGPFGLDAWRYRKASGELALHPLGEINARMTMGLLTHAWVERLALQREHPALAKVCLRIGREVPVHDAARRITPLLHPANSGSPGAWLEW